MGKVTSNVLYGLLVVSVSMLLAVFVVRIATCVPASPSGWRPGMRVVAVHPPEIPDQIPFDSVAWRADRYSLHRVKMADGAMAALKLGMSGGEVEALIGKHYTSPMEEFLGNPDEQSPWFRNLNYSGPRGVRYRGYTLGGFADDEYVYRRHLCLYFDAEDRLVGKDLYWRRKDPD